MKRSTILFLTSVSLAFLVCCSDIRTETNPAKLLGRTLTLPKGGHWTIMGRDTALSIRSIPKIVVYYNAEGCRSCRMKQLSNWKELLNDFEKLKKKDSLNVEFIFIVRAAADDKLLVGSIREREFDIPVLCDQAGEFERCNVLPEDILYHAFLLNEHNRILLIGAPIFSPGLWSRYIAKIVDLSRR